MGEREAARAKRAPAKRAPVKRAPAKRAQRKRATTSRTTKGSAAHLELIRAPDPEATRAAEAKARRTSIIMLLIPTAVLTVLGLIMIRQRRFDLGGGGLRDQLLVLQPAALLRGGRIGRDGGGVAPAVHRVAEAVRADADRDPPADADRPASFSGDRPVRRVTLDRPRAGHDPARGVPEAGTGGLRGHGARQQVAQDGRPQAPGHAARAGARVLRVAGHHAARPGHDDRDLRVGVRVDVRRGRTDALPGLDRVRQPVGRGLPGVRRGLPPHALRGFVPEPVERPARARGSS